MTLSEWQVAETVPYSPPHSIEAEEATVGAVFIEPDCYHDIVQTGLTPQDFYIERLRWIWEAFAALHDKRAPIDFLTVSDVLERRGRLAELGGSAYLTKLIPSTSLNATAYAQIVRGDSLRRKIIAAANKAATFAYDTSKDPDTALLNSHEELDAITPAYRTHTSPLGDRILASAFDASEKGDVPGIPTGLHGLNRLLGGFMDGDLVYIGGRPGEGKSGLLATSFRAALKTFHYPALFSLEMGDVSVGQRLIAQEKDMNTYRIRQGRLEGEEWERLRQGTEWLNELEHEHRFHIDEKPAVNAAYIHAVCKRLKSRGLLDIIFVDYVQLMSASGKSLYEQVSNSSKRLKEIALDLNVPVVSAAQLNRSADERRPRLADLKESGGLEQDADVVIFIWREGEPVNHDIDTSVRVSVAKHRNGPTGDLMKNGNSLVQFRKSCTRFEDSAL